MVFSSYRLQKPFHFVDYYFVWRIAHLNRQKHSSKIIKKNVAVLRYVNHDMIMGDAVVEGSGNIGYLGLFNVPLNLSIHGLLAFSPNAAAIRSRELQARSRTPEPTDHRGGYL